MKNTISKLTLFLAILAMLTFSAAIVSAETIVPETIRIAETEHGTVQVVQDADDPAKARITLTPAEGYMTASISLRKEWGQAIAIKDAEGNANQFICEIPDTESTLTVTFRRARVVLSEEQLAMDSEGKGKTADVSATISYTDGDINTRRRVFSQKVIWASSDPDVVTVDENGKLTARKLGYSRISAYPYYGNDSSEAYFYVIVDGDKDEKVGTIQVNAYFDDALFVSEGVPGHSFLIFTNTSGRDITINTRDFYECNELTDEFYKTVAEYDGEGYDPLTYFYATEGGECTEENAAARQALVDRYIVSHAKGELTSYTVKDKCIATFGNNGNPTDDETTYDIFFSGDFAETLERLGLSWDFEKLQADLLSGRISVTDFYKNLISLALEIGYDLSTGYNPITYPFLEGGEGLNHEFYGQAYYRNYSDAVGIKTDITEVQLMAMVDFLQYNNWFNMYSRNCTLLAVGGWNLATVTHPAYNLDANWGGYTSALAAPLFLRNNILMAASSLAYDENVTCYSKIGVVKPALLAKEGSYGGNEIQPLFGTFKENLMFQCLSLDAGETYNTKKFGEWTTSDFSVVSVTGTGCIRAKKSGISVLTCTGDLSFFCYLVIVK